MPSPNLIDVAAPVSALGAALADCSPTDAEALAVALSTLGAGLPAACPLRRARAAWPSWPRPCSGRTGPPTSNTSLPILPDLARLPRLPWRGALPPCPAAVPCPCPGGGGRGDPNVARPSRSSRPQPGPALLLFCAGKTRKSIPVTAFTRLRPRQKFRDRHSA